jgi:enoyl-CoA hydratase/carnithine racemase
MELYRQIRYERDGAVATVVLNRPQARNGLTLQMSNELASALDEADQDDGVRVVILTGAGADFCAGADLSGGAQSSLGAVAAGQDEDAPETGWKEPAGRCSMRIFAMNKPVIAAVHGAVVGAGATITLPCDYRLAASDARFGFVFSRRGVYPEGASAWFLPRLVGLGTSLDWMISGRVFKADEALKAGLVNQVHAAKDLPGKAHDLATQIAESTAPVSVAVIRRLLYWASSAESPFEVQRLDSRLVASLVSNSDAFEGLLSFLERRPPHFSGRIGRDMPRFLPWLGCSAGDDGC